MGGLKYRGICMATGLDTSSCEHKVYIYACYISQAHLKTMFLRSGKAHCLGAYFHKWSISIEIGGCTARNILFQEASFRFINYGNQLRRDKATSNTGLESPQESLLAAFLT